MDWISKKSSCDLKNWRYIINIKYPYFAWAWVMNVCFFMGQDHQQSNLQAHNGSKWLKLARKRLTLICLMWFLATFSISFSGKWMSFKFKIYQTVTIISMTSQFHEFLKSKIWRVFAIRPSCVAQPEHPENLHFQGYKSTTRITSLV